MDVDEDGCVTEAEFVKACLNNRFLPLFLLCSCFCSFIGGSGEFTQISLIGKFAKKTYSFLSFFSSNFAMMVILVLAVVQPAWQKFFDQILDLIFRRFSTMLALKLIDLFTVWKVLNCEKLHREIQKFILSNKQLLKGAGGVYMAAISWVFISSPFLWKEKKGSIVKSLLRQSVQAKALSGMGHALPYSVTFSKSETATLGLALLVLLAALLLGIIVVATFYCLLIRWHSISGGKIYQMCFRRKARNEVEFVSWVYRMHQGKALLIVCSIMIFSLIILQLTRKALAPRSKREVGAAAGSRFIYACSSGLFKHGWIKYHFSRCWEGERGTIRKE